jgi:hypothetical protein
MKLIDRIALHKTVSMILDFIIAIIKLFAQPNKGSDKPRRIIRWRKNEN